jgi:hypothetical protein
LTQQLNANGVRAASVHNGVPAEQRQAIYHQFNNGEIDVLTFVGVLGEGWDSQRAKGLINARPTRSNIFSKQRLGRVTRPGATAFAIDIYDDFESQNLPITVADVLNEGTIDYGNVIGTPEDTERVHLVLEGLRNVAADSLMANLRGVYKEQAQYIAGLEKLYRGQLLDAQGKAEYATSTAINRSYHGITDEIIARYEELYGVTIPKKIAAQGKVARTVYAVKEGGSILYDIPRVNPERYHLDPNKDKWVAPQGIVQLFSKRYPKVDESTISEMLEIVGGSLEWIPAKYMTTPENATFRHYNVIKMYRGSNDTIEVLDKALAEYYS